VKTIRTYALSKKSVKFFACGVVLAILGLMRLDDLSAQFLPFRVNPHLYPDNSNASTEVSMAIRQAIQQHKRILLDFGGNWCADCQVLDYYYHQSPNNELLDKYFVLVHVNIGHMDENSDIAEKYRVPIRKGVPALAILDSRGDLLYSEKEKEFEHPSAPEITTFLTRWKP
jgi:thiol:disulfide interchange protein